MDFSCFPLTSQAPGIAIAGACLRGVIWAKSDLTTVAPCPPQGHPLVLPTEHAAALRFWHRCHSHLTLRLGQEHCRWQLGRHSEHRATSINQPKIEHVQKIQKVNWPRKKKWNKISMKGGRNGYTVVTIHTQKKAKHVAPFWSPCCRSQATREMSPVSRLITAAGKCCESNPFIWHVWSLTRANQIRSANQWLIHRQYRHITGGCSRLAFNGLQ